jgi:hypothetical protein
LAGGEAVELIGPGRPPAAFDWALGAGSGKVLERGDGTFCVSSTGLGACLVDLQPALPPGRYRIDADLRHDAGDGHSAVGVYVAGGRCHVGRGRQVLFAGATFADYGPLAAPPGRVYFRLNYFGESRQYSYECRMRHIAERDAAPDQPPPAPGDWRRLSFDVAAAGVVAAVPAGPVGAAAAADLDQFRSGVVERWSDLSAVPFSCRPHGAVGVYVFSGVMSVRRVAVTPLPPEGSVRTLLPQEAPMQLHVDPGPFNGKITGTGVAGETVTIKYGNNTFGPVTVGPDGKWSVPFNEPAGNYTVDVNLDGNLTKQLTGYTVVVKPPD